MESKHKELIQRNYETLVNDSMSIDHIARILVNKGVISHAFTENSKNKRSLERKRILFQQILNCGKNAFRELVLAFRETNQEKLANLLDAKRKYVTTQALPNRRVFSNGVLSIKLKRAAKFCDIDSEVPTYKCRSKNRGAILIANNYTFDLSDLGAREGSQYDVTNLKSLFGQMNFQIELVENQAGEDLEKAIMEFFKNNHKYDCLFLILMSHGGQDSQGTYVYGTDGYRLYTSNIEHYASNVISSQLYGVPKILLYNICRGDKVDMGTTATMSRTATESAATLKVQSLSDILIGNATLMDYVAHRDFEKGAWYIRNFVEVMEKYAHVHHIEDMLKIVYQRVSKHRSDGFSMQTPTYTNIGFQQLYLNPGIYEENGKMKLFDNGKDNIEIVQNQCNGNVVPGTSNAVFVVTKENVGSYKYIIDGDTVEN